MERNWRRGVRLLGVGALLGCGFLQPADAGKPRSNLAPIVRQEPGLVLPEAADVGMSGAVGDGVIMLPPADGTMQPIPVGPGGPPGCPNGECPPYYRDRPKGCDKDKKRHIILNNRMNEPEWYRYYRCQHYGYHPTQWAPWPEGWLSCRKPQPGPHPYDLKQPEPKSAAKTPKGSTERSAEPNVPNVRPEPAPLNEPPRSFPPIPPTQRTSPPSAIQKKT